MNLEICHFILKKVLKWQISRFLSYAKLSVSSRHIRVLGQFQINKKLTSKQTQQTQQQTFPSFPHNLHFFPTAKPNATYIFVLILANDELFEFCVSCGEFGGNMKVFVEFVLRLIFVDLKLSQNPYMPTTFFCFSFFSVFRTYPWLIVDDHRIRKRPCQSTSFGSLLHKKVQTKPQLL